MGTLFRETTLEGKIAFVTPAIRQFHDNQFLTIPMEEKTVDVRGLSLQEAWELIKKKTK